MNPFHLLQAAPSAATSPLVQMVPYILMFVIFYFVLLAPMRKQQKKQKRKKSWPQPHRSRWCWQKLAN